MGNDQSASVSALKIPKLLPTLGLTKYKKMDLSVNRVNPFAVNPRTEQLLVQQERERDFQFFGKVENNHRPI